MRKTIALLLALVMCLTLCACGSEKEKMLEEATTISMDSIMDKYFDICHDLDWDLANEILGEQTIKWTGTLYRFQTEKLGSNIFMAERTDENGFPINCMPIIFSEGEHGIDNINDGDTITIVGIFHLNPNAPNVSDKISEPYASIDHAFIIDAGD